MKHARPIKMWWLIIVVCLIAGFPGCAKKTLVTTSQGAPAVINKIEPLDVDGKTEIIVEGTGPLLQYTSFQLTDPLRLILDITDADLGTLKDKISVNSGAVTDITPSQKDNIARLEIGLSQAVDTKVNQVDGKLIVEVVKPAAENKQAAEEIKTASEIAAPSVPQEAPKEENVGTPPPASGAATTISSVQATAGKDGVKVVISGNGTIAAKILKLDGNRIAINIPGVKNKARPNVIPVRKGGLVRVRVGQHPDKVSVVLDLTKPMDYTATPDGNSLIIALNAVPTIAKSQEKPAQELSVSQEQQATVSEKEVTTTTQEIPAPVSPPAQQDQVAATPEKEAVVPQETKVTTTVTQERTTTTRKQQGLGRPESELVTGGNRFTGRKISLDLQDADLINVMRLFAEVANLNIILAPDVKGKVTVRMVNIPWDQAMEIILKMNGLSYILEDNVLRIASVGALTKEAEEDLKAKEAKRKAEDLITRIIPINYATAAAIDPTIKKSLSPRGETVVDARTNTLIVKDIARYVDDIVSLIKILDKPTAQIMIEARIVEASLNFTRQIGIQWGGLATASAATGNPISGLSSASVTGASTLGATQSGTGNWVVNMPATVTQGSGGALAFALSSLSKAYNLDLILSALESLGEGKVISQPKISALDNKEAKVEQGLSIPYATTSTAGATPTIQFIDAKLSLTVTPHATPDNKIYLKVIVTKNAPDTSIPSATGQPAILKNEATTEILLGDGETAVIGGILTIDRTVTDSKVPWLADIPFLGWLFKNRSITDTRGELLIFLTPRIVKQAVI